MIFLGQDKGHGPKWLKPLSAHLFSRDGAEAGRDVDLAQCGLPLEKKSGTLIKKYEFTSFLAVLP